MGSARGVGGWNPAPRARTYLEWRKRARMPGRTDEVTYAEWWVYELRNEKARKAYDTDTAKEDQRDRHDP